MVQIFYGFEEEKIARVNEIFRKRRKRVITIEVKTETYIKRET